MQKRWRFSYLQLLLLFMLLGYNGCPSLRTTKTFNDTVTGNPMAPAASRILAAVCGVLSRCDSQVSLSRCQADVLATGNLEAPLGLPQGSYGSYSNIAQAEIARVITPDLTATDTCAAKIESLSCLDSAVQAAYDPNSPNPFAAVGAMIPTSQASSCPSVYKQKVKAFPTAEGFGQDTVGGRSGRVVRVTTLSDSGPGSFREALASFGPRLVVFDVSGTITLQSDIILDSENQSYVTVAGQTSPGGVQMKGPFGIWLVSGFHDGIFRHLRFRPGGPFDLQRANGILTYGPGRSVYNVIVDHCSIEWNYQGPGPFGAVTNVTYQWNLIANGLTDGTNAGYGLSMDSHAGDLPSYSASFHHNLVANEPNTSASLPRANVVDFRNNIVYAWKNNNALYWGGYINNRSALGNHINNYYISGPSSWPDSLWVSNAGPIRVGDGLNAELGGTKIYTEGTWGPNCLSGCADDWDNRFFNLDDYAQGIPNYPLAEASTYRSLTPFPVPPVTTSPTSQLKSLVLNSVGAIKPSRDAVDAEVINDVNNGTVSFTANATGGPWPTLSGGAPPADSDGDAIPDAWESSHGLDPNNSSDGAALSTNGYTNVENYLNELAGD